MRIEEVIDKQREWIKKLVVINKGRPLLGQYLENRMDDFKKPWLDIDYRDDLLVTRQILKNEIVFDFDYKDWSKVREEGNKLIKYLNKENIIYITALSGGKGLHIHLFLDTASLTIDENIGNNLNKSIEIPRVVRKCIYDEIVRKAKLKKVDSKNAEGLDTRKVYFTSVDGKGSLIRDFGCVRNSLEGQVKSMWVGEIPAIRPDVTFKNMVFPENVPLMYASRWNALVGKELVQMNKVFSKASATVIDIRGHGRQIPCYCNVLKGVSRGARNNAVFTLARLGCFVGNPIEETISDMTVFCDNSDFSLTEATTAIKSAYRKRDTGSFCGTIIDSFGVKICDRKLCPIYAEKHKDEVSQSKF